MNQSSTSGVFYAFSAFTLWAIAPIYFKSVAFVPPTEILAHRIVWSCLLVLLLIAGLRKGAQLMKVLRSGKAFMSMLASTLLIGLNWGTFIWAVNSNHMLSASLGYYINPLVSILLGMIFFGERLDLVKKVAVALCLVAVVFEVIQFGTLPWVALILALTFGFYGLVRKKVAVDSFTGMALETGLMFPVAVLYLMWAGSPTSNLMENSAWTNWMLFLAGPVTMIPLMFFAAAATRVSLTTIGFFQYIGPSGMFVLAVFLYDEPLSSTKLVTFALIWSALAILVFDSVRKMRQPKPLAPPADTVG